MEIEGGLGGFVLVKLVNLFKKKQSVIRKRYLRQWPL